MEHVDGLSGQAEVHGRHSELHAAAALHENHRIFVRDSEQLAQLSFRIRVDAFKFRRAVAHFHHRHAAAMPVEQFFADALEH